jgi:hypothetical protein
MILALTPDLMDRSKVAAAAKELGQEVRFVARAELVEGLAAELAPRVVVLDLSRPDALAAIAAVAGPKGRRVVAFGSHVDRELLSAAGDAGCDEVLARSQFFADPAAVLAG